MRLIASAAIAAASLGLVACGSSDKKASSTTKGTGTTAQSTVTLPGVSGQDVATAQSRIQAAGLQSTLRKRYSDQAKGQVLKTYPAGGTLVARGSMVDLIVSRGPKPVQQVSTTPSTGGYGGNGSSGGSGGSGSGSNGGTPSLNTRRGQQQLHSSPDCKNAPPPPPGYTGPVQC